jgi:hypothetical protein
MRKAISKGMRTGVLKVVLVLVLYQIIALSAEVAVDTILKECEDTGLEAEDCEALLESNGHVADISVVSALQHTNRNAPDPYYYQVYLYVDFHGYVLGRSVRSPFSFCGIMFCLKFEIPYLT